VTDHERVIRANFRRNFIVNVSDVGFYLLGMAVVSSGSVLPLYLLHLTSNPVLIGLIPSLQFLGWRLPQLFTANWVSRMPRKLPYVLWISLNERLPLLFLGLFIIFWRSADNGLTLAIVFLLLGWGALGGGLLATPWQEFVAKIIPPRRWGLFFGTGNALGAVLGVGGAALSAYLLARYGYPSGFAYCFLAAFGFVVISFFSLALSVEPAVEPTAPRVSQLAFMRQLPDVLRRDANFRNYLLVRSFGAFSGMGAAFMAVHAVERYHLGDSAAGTFTAVALAATAILNPVLGHLGDRRSHKTVLGLSYSFLALSMVLAALAPSLPLFLLAFAIRAGSDAAFMSSGMTIIFEFCDPEDRPMYIGLGNTLTAPPLLVVPLIGGAVAAAFGYVGVFWASAALSLLSVVAWERLVRDPRRRVLPGAAAAANGRHGIPQLQEVE